MASINVGYSSKVGEVKDMILNDIIPNNQLPKLDIEKFSTKLCDLWDPIQSEDFVFCFRNHMEINAHMNLEAKMNDIRWELNKLKLVTLRGMKNKRPEDENAMFNELKMKMDKAYEVYKEQVDKFFSETDDGKLLSDWKTHHLKKLEKITEDKVESSRKLIRAKIKIQKVKDEAGRELEKWKTEARQHAIDYAKMKLDQGAGGKVKQEELEKNFIDLWNALRKKINPPNVADNVESVVRNGLRDMGGIHVSHTEAINFDKKVVHDFEVQDKHFSEEQGKATSTEKEKFEKISRINKEVSCNIITDVETYMFEITDDIFSRSHVEQMVKIVSDNISKWNSKNPEINLTKQYNADMLKFAAQIAFPYFKKMQDTYKNQIDTRQEMDVFKEEIRTRFMDTIQKIDQERTEATVFTNELVRLIQKRVDKDLVDFLPGDIRDRNFVLNSKKEFMKRILKDLLAEDKFDKYMEYLNKTSEYFSQSLQKYVREYLFDQKMYSQHAIRKAEHVTNQILQILRKNAPLMSGNSDARKCTGILHSLANILPEIRDSTTQITDTFVKNNVKADMFYSYLINNVEKIPNALRDTYSKMKEIDAGVEDQICSQILDHVRGCQKKCPFCHVLCMSAQHDHEKECRNPQHYPIGMQGYKKQNKIVIETCNSLVGSTDKFRYEGGDIKIPVRRKIINFIIHLDKNFNSDIVNWRDYKKVYKDWDIEVNRSFDGSLYWKRLLAKFRKELAARYQVQPPDVPQEWHDIKKEEAVSSLD